MLLSPKIVLHVILDVDNVHVHIELYLYKIMYMYALHLHTQHSPQEQFSAWQEGMVWAQSLQSHQGIWTQTIPTPKKYLYWGLLDQYAGENTVIDKTRKNHYYIESTYTDVLCDISTKVLMTKSTCPQEFGTGAAPWSNQWALIDSSCPPPLLGCPGYQWELSPNPPHKAVALGIMDTELPACVTTTNPYPPTPL